MTWSIIARDTDGAFGVAVASKFFAVGAICPHGEAAGGDKRGKQSAALMIWTTEEYPAVSLRVDDHDDPLAELKRLESIGRQRLFHYVNFMPSRANPNG